MPFARLRIITNVPAANIKNSMTTIFVETVGPVLQRPRKTPDRTGKCDALGRLPFRSQRFQRLFHQFTPYFFFLLRRNIGIADDVNDAVAQYGAVGAYHLCNGKSGRNLNRWNAGLFEFSCDRSAAAGAGPSRGRKDNCINAQLFHSFSHLAAHAPRIGKRVG